MVKLYNLIKVKSDVGVLKNIDIARTCTVVTLERTENLSEYISKTIKEILDKGKHIYKIEIEMESKIYLNVYSFATELVED